MRSSAGLIQNLSDGARGTTCAPTLRKTFEGSPWQARMVVCLPYTVGSAAYSAGAQLDVSLHELRMSQEALLASGGPRRRYGTTAKLLINVVPNGGGR